jgi:hypothetical protein
MRQEGGRGFVRPNAWRRTLPLALAAVALVAFASAALAEPDPWQQAAARVEFPIYRPAVTLGFAPGPVVVERCGDSGNTWVRASYSEGSGDRKAVFGFHESYPRHCGDGGERMTVTSADINAVGMGIRETHFVLRPGDAHCFPTGGTRSRTWRWNGSRFTSGPWTRSKPATPKTPSSTRPSGYLKTPSNNIACVYWLGTAPPSIRCRIASGLVPEPRTDRPGCPRTDDVVLRATGRPTIGGRSICRGEDEGDAGPLAALPVARVLAYGKTWAGEGLRCTSAETGLTCRNRVGHGFFLSRERWRAFPG